MSRHLRVLKAFIFLVITSMIFSPSGASAQELTPPRPDNWPKPMNYFGLMVPATFQNPSKVTISPEAPDMSSGLAGESIWYWALITYQTYSLGNWDIKITDEFPLSSSMLTTYTSQEITPRLNRGATKVVFASNIYSDYEVLSKDIATGVVANLTNNTGNDYTPEWSPDGTKIVFVGMSSSTNPDIYVVNANGTNITRLTNTLTEMDYYPTWSPDGNKIMWVKADANGLGAIWMMNSDGTNKVAFSNQIWYMQHPIWSKDGSKIAFDADLDGDGWNELASVNSDGTNFEIRLDLNTNLREPWAGSWSPNGYTIFYTDVQYVQDTSGNLLLYSVDVKRNSYVGNTYAFTTTGYDMNPDYKVSELLPPISNASPLSELSPAADFAVSCAGVDQGVSGISSYDFQYRVLPSDVWVDFPRTTSSSAFYSPSVGTTACFRCRAIDNAFNFESWPAPGTEESCTTFFTWDFSGKITDNRGAPLANDSLDISPDPGGELFTDEHGNFHARLYSEGLQTISVNSGLPEPFSATINNVDSNMDLNFYAVPGNSIITNGGFEEGLTGWALSGALDSRVTSAVYNTGAAGFELGSSCPVSGCISSPEEIGTGYSGSLVVDNLGFVHVISAETINNVQGVYYRTRNLEGIWSDPTLVAISGGAITDLIIDSSQTLHAAWSQPYLIPLVNTLDLTYAYKKIGEPWSQVELVNGKGLPRLAIDDNENIFLVAWSDATGLNYFKRSNEGVWSPPTLVYKEFVAPFDVTKTDDGAIHVAYANRSNDKVYHFSIKSDGHWTPEDTIYSQIITDNNGTLLAKAPHNSVYFMVQDGLATQGGGVVFGIRDQYGTSNTLSNQAYNWSSIGSDKLGSVNQFTSLGSNGFYFSRTVDGDWEEPELIFQNTQYSILKGDTFVDFFDYPHYLMPKKSSLNVYSFSYFRLKQSGMEESESISQQVSIPEEMAHPTLAFMHRSWRLTPDSQSGLEVLVTDEINQTSLLNLGYSADWTQVWADMTPWIGKTITITFKLNQVASDPYVKFFLDDISLGSWSTPWIESVDPGSLETFDQDLISIHGQNFLGPMNLFINQIQIANFTMVDEQTIQFNLPGGLNPGIYDVSIITSVGQEALLRSALRLGQAIFIPLVSR